MQKKTLKNLTSTAFILGTLVAGLMNVSAASAACDNSKLGPYCIEAANKKIAQCAPGATNKECVHRWEMAQAKCSCDIGCEGGRFTCEEAKAFCAKDEESHHCDDLHK